MVSRPCSIAAYGSGQLAPPLNVGFLGAIVNAAGTTVTPRIIDGVMALGIDRLAHG
jgi:hypothetical protein